MLGVGSRVRNAAALVCCALLASPLACSHTLPSLDRRPADQVTLPDVFVDPGAGLVRVHERTDLPPALRALVDAIGLTSSGCTATHVGGGRVLTAGHCLRSQQHCAQTLVHWGYLEGRAPSMSSRCTRVLAAEREMGLDYAVFQVDQPPEVAIPIGPAPVSDARYYTVTMMGYPSGAPLHWSGLCPVVNPYELPSGLSHALARATMFHLCPSAKGSSGSPLIDPVTLHVIGIHMGAMPPWNLATPLMRSGSSLARADYPRL